MALTFNPDVFAVRNHADARAIILTQEAPDATTEQRWAAETPYLAELIEQRLALTADSLVIDYGCGVGRMAKALIERCGCNVLGVDASASMRVLAADYVVSPRFLSCSPELLDAMVAAGLRANAAIATWVLQHCFDPGADVARIAGALAPGSGFFLVNNINRAVPTVERPWVDDGKALRPLIEASFSQVADGALDPAHVSQAVSDFAFWAYYRLER